MNSASPTRNSALTWVVPPVLVVVVFLVYSAFTDGVDAELVVALVVFALVAVALGIVGHLVTKSREQRRNDDG